MEHGLNARQMQKWKTNKPLCQKNIGNFGSVSIYEAVPIFSLIITGFILSFITVWIEIIIAKTNQATELKNLKNSYS